MSTKKYNNMDLTTEKRSVLKPLSFPWAWEACEIQHKMHWLPYEISLNNDLNDFKNKLTDQERHLVTQILRFFTQADLEVGRRYIDYYLHIFKCPEIRMMLTSFASMETIHIIGYSYLITGLRLPDSEYKKFLAYEEMTAKYDYMQNFSVDNPQSIALTLAIVSGAIEGIVLFASFAILIAFSMRRKQHCLSGTGQIVAFSMKDEILHCLSMIRLFKTYLEENKHLIDIDQLHRDIYDNYDKLLKMEDKFIDLCFENCNLDFINAQELKLYIRYLADLRLNQLGLSSLYNQKENPIPWINEFISPPEVVNFFEHTGTAYSKPGNIDMPIDPYSFL